MIPLKDVIPIPHPSGRHDRPDRPQRPGLPASSSRCRRSEVEDFILVFGLVPADFSVLDVFTSMFVHGGFGHVAGNLLYLWIFGDNVEDRLGHGRFLVFYLAAASSPPSRRRPSTRAR